MLVITRKTGDSLVISDDIKITLLSIGGDKVSLGIDAPKSVSIIRGELLEIIEANKESVEKAVNKNYRDIAAMIKNKKI
jgi:carbon storage regulator